MPVREGLETDIQDDDSIIWFLYGEVIEEEDARDLITMDALRWFDQLERGAITIRFYYDYPRMISFRGLNGLPSSGYATSSPTIIEKTLETIARMRERNGGS